MTTFQTRLLKELAQGPDSPIAESNLVYLQERLRGRFFDFLLERFESAQSKGLTQAKLARRLRKSPEVIHRWLSAPTNLTLDSISDLLVGVSAEEPNFSASSLLNLSPVNQWHLDDASVADSLQPLTQEKQQRASVLGEGQRQGSEDKGQRQGAGAVENATLS